MKNKSKFLTFIFSILPGAGQMYFGFMKQGMTIMLIFFFTMFLVDFLRASFLLVILPVIWCYGFFDTWNKAGLSVEESAQLEDKSILESLFPSGLKPFTIKHKWLGIILIIIGLLLLSERILLPTIIKVFKINHYLFRETMKTIIVSGSLIALGIWFIKGKKIDYEESSIESAKSNTVHDNTIYDNAVHDKYKAENDESNIEYEESNGKDVKSMDREV